MRVDLDETLIARAVLYRFLALGFHEPGDILLAFLKSDEEFSHLREAARYLEQDQGEKPLGLLVDQTSAAVQAANWSLRDLRVEYNRLFLGPTPPLAPPYESVYDQSRPEEDLGTVQGPSAETMEFLLKEEHLEVDLGRVDLYDHIAIELEYMYYLLRKAVAGETVPDQDYANRADAFLKDRLALWAPGFGEKVASKTDQALYHDLGRLLAEFVRMDSGRK